MPAQHEIVAALREQVQRLQGMPRPLREQVLKTPWPELNRLLPHEGFCRGRLIEWIGAAAGSGAGTLALRIAQLACADGGTLVVVDRQHWFYPPAAVALGLPREQLLLVRPASDADEIWALDQALRCEAVSAVWSFSERLHARCFRRLQLSAEAGRCLGLLVRPRRAASQPGWSHLRFSVQSLPGGFENARLRLELLRSLEGTAGGVAEIDLVCAENSP